jgi:hypothetical protein
MRAQTETDEVTPSTRPSPPVCCCFSLIVANGPAATAMTATATAPRRLSDKISVRWFDKNTE